MRSEPVIAKVIAVCVVVVALLDGSTAYARPAGCTVSLQPSAPSPQLVGERIVWTATAASCGSAPVYQFRVVGGPENKESGKSGYPPKRNQDGIVRDFSLDNSFAWAPMEEGAYEVSVKVKDGFDSVTATSVVVSDTVSSRVTGKDAVVTPTLNP
ncbi:MAG: hypothetical protein ABJC07_08745, partial [Acidobacteriota bacterium]